MFYLIVLGITCGYFGMGWLASQRRYVSIGHTSLLCGGVQEISLCVGGYFFTVVCMGGYFKSDCGWDTALSQTMEGSGGESLKIKVSMLR